MIIENDIEKLILKILYENRFERPINRHVISRIILKEQKADSRQVEYYLNCLNDKRLCRREKQPKLNKPKGYKEGPLPWIGSNENIYRYQINENGQKCYESGYYYEATNHMAEIAQNTTDMKDTLNFIGGSIVNILNAMGYQHQKTLEEQIETNKLLEEYICLFKSKEQNNEGNIIKFFKKLSGDVALMLIKEVINRGMGT